MASFEHRCIDVSVSFDGTIWAVVESGAVITSTDGGESFTTLPGEGGFENISAGRYGISWAVKSDGRLFMWHPIPSRVTPPPPPPIPPPLPPPPPPVISISVQGSGISSVFVASGSGFDSASSVSIRVTRFDEKGTFHEARFPTTLDGAGRIAQNIAIPCLSGIVLNFSAIDGRFNPADLTGFLWSNAVPTGCP